MRYQQRFSFLTFAILSLSSTLLFHLQPITTVGANSDVNTTASDYIRTSCGATLYPDLCYTSLSYYASVVQQDPYRLACTAMNISLSEANITARYLSGISSGGNNRTAATLDDCISVFGDAVSQIRRSIKQMRRVRSGSSSVRFQLSNVETWMSAALTNEDTCTDGFDGVSDGDVKSDVRDRVAKVKKVTSIALALVNNYASTVTMR